jgi:iron-sulfur cluster repair protein YtfE (RIC family)
MKYKIIDTETGKRVDDVGKKEKNDLKKIYPIRRIVEKGIEKDEELSPMDPPEAYDTNYAITDVDFESMAESLHSLIDEHKEVIGELNNFEASLIAFQKEGFRMTKEISDSFSVFFSFFDSNILVHNRKEERHLFPILKQRLIESGEHSKEAIPKTPVDLMEDDHIKFIQLASLTFNILGLATRLPDNRSRMLTFDVAYNSGIELVELLRLHIYREDNILFPLAQKLLTKTEFLKIEEKLTFPNEGSLN